MNRQRKVLTTITYNEMGIIIDTKSEELDLFAEPQERTGKWERKMDGVFCSNCHKGWDFIRGVPAEVETEYKFCPRCGKRMEVEHENN